MYVIHRVLFHLLSADYIMCIGFYTCYHLDPAILMRVRQARLLSDSQVVMADEDSPRILPPIVRSLPPKLKPESVKIPPDRARFTGCIVLICGALYETREDDVPS